MYFRTGWTNKKTQQVFKQKNSTKLLRLLNLHQTIHNEKTTLYYNHCIHKDHDKSSGRYGGEPGFIGLSQGFTIWGPESVTFIIAPSQDTKHCFSTCRMRSVCGIEIRAKCQILLVQMEFLLTNHSVLLSYGEFTGLCVVILKGCTWLT